MFNSYPKANPFDAAMNISSFSLNPFSVSKQTEKYSELDTLGWKKKANNDDVIRKSSGKSCKCWQNKISSLCCVFIVCFTYLTSR